ncbi:MAG: hypothetical protein U5L96_18070 [Owenweeksia sp.]|nr:hypothetical protein [Owenweeksia sp.]
MGHSIFVNGYDHNATGILIKAVYQTGARFVFARQIFKVINQGIYKGAGVIGNAGYVPPYPASLLSTSRCSSSYDMWSGIFPGSSSVSRGG